VDRVGPCLVEGSACISVRPLGQQLAHTLAASPCTPGRTPSCRWDAADRSGTLSLVAIEEVLLIGGSAGVGKSSVGWEISVQLNRLGVAHWHLEGDVLDAAWPRPEDDQDGQRMTVNTLRAMAGVFAGEGYTRCIYVQTASVIDSHLVTKALGDIRMVGVLLTASEATRFQRLSGREIGTDLDRHLESTRRMAERLERESPEWVVRIATDDRGVAAIARDVIERSGWT
jgi:pimeloyl-ACP methyl ester carboxylesterase